jgi:two-component system, response regulator
MLLNQLVMETKNVTILLVEDNESDIELAKRALRKENIATDIVVARDGQEALDYMFGRGQYAGRDVSQMPALVLLDLQLPLLDGTETLRHIRADKRTQHQIVVVLTSSLEKTDLINCYDLGVNSYIRKPVDFAKFTEVLKCLGQYWLSINEPPPSK